MASNINQFVRTIGEFADEEIPRVVKNTRDKLALQADRRLVQRSPVDTGRFQNNWHPSIGFPDSRVIGGEPGNTKQATIARNATAIVTADPFEVIVLQNNLPYGERLEMGHSRQAPQGMLAITVTELSGQFGE